MSPLQASKHTQTFLPKTNNEPSKCKSCCSSRSMSVALTALAVLAAVLVATSALGLSGHLPSVSKFIGKHAIPFTIASSIGLVLFSALGLGLGCKKTPDNIG